MKRHTVDGAEILRSTPDMPTLAPVVAFEHHLRRDGSRLPDGVTRAHARTSAPCSAASRTSCDAMRSQRAIPGSRFRPIASSPCSGAATAQQFDQHLVRRFVQLIGIYPAGNLVRLNTGEIGVVLHVHAPDPYRPRVRIVVDPDGYRLD